MRRIWLGVLAFGLTALPAVAQEKEPEQEPPARDERPHIQVLKHPYDIASFYRAPGGNPRGGFTYPGYSDPYADPAGLYGNSVSEAGLPLSAYRPDLRGRVFGPRWDSEFGGSNPNYQLNGWGTRRRFAPRRAEDAQPKPAPARP